jgi:hypothetical protein
MLLDRRAFLEQIYLDPCHAKTVGNEAAHGASTDYDDLRGGSFAESHGNGAQCLFKVLGLPRRLRWNKNVPGCGGIASCERHGDDCTFLFYFFFLKKKKKNHSGSYIEFHICSIKALLSTPGALPPPRLV